LSVQSLPISKSKREFSVAGEHIYNRKSPARWVLSHLLHHKLLLFSFLVSVVITNILFATIPRLTGLAFDEVLKAEPNARRLLEISLFILGIVLVRGVLDIINSFSIETLGQRLERDSREELYLSLLGKSQTFHNRQRVGDIMARAGNDVRQLNPMMNPGVSLIIESAISLVVPLVFIALLSPPLLLSPILFIITFVFTLRHYMRQLNPVSAKMRQQFGNVNAELNETITGIEVVKAMVQEAQEKQKFMKSAGLYRDYFVDQGRIQARYLPILFLGFAITGAFAHGLYLLSLGQLTVGELVAYMGLMGVLRFPAFISIFTFSLVQMGLAGAERILELLRQETELDENPSGHSAPIKGELVFDGVTFDYASNKQSDATLKDRTILKDQAVLKDKAILKNLSFRAAPGETIAIVGQTGSGKSTLTKLVNRIYDVSEGRILIDGVDVKQWNLESLRSQISVIEQDIFLFSRSISDNIAFGLGNKASPESIRDAAKAAQAHDFTMSFQDGYDTVIGERGVTLSGGQRQRLAIARALLTDPRILILDDSTSAIDSATEDDIQKAINKVLDGRTTLMITHRLSQIRRADKILVLDRGELVAHGTHEELSTTSALYQRIFARYT
jgi:ATP-binding cassette, subfamily B, bacterial